MEESVVEDAEMVESEAKEENPMIEMNPNSQSYSMTWEIEVQEVLEVPMALEEQQQAVKVGSIDFDEADLASREIIPEGVPNVKEPESIPVADPVDRVSAAGTNSGCQLRRHSSPMVGFWVQRSGAPSLLAERQMLQPMHSRIRSSCPWSILCGRNGSAIDGRAAPMKS